MVKVNYTIKNEEGLHARPASDLCKEAANFKSSISLLKDGEEYDVATPVQEWLYKEDLTIIGEGEGTNELGEYVVGDGKDGKKVYYLNEKGKYRPKQPGEV